MMEDCAPGMSTPHGCTDDSDVIATFKEALKQRVGHERFQIWFSGVRFVLEAADAVAGTADPSRSIVAVAAGQFAADRLSNHYLAAMRGAAASACGASTTVRVHVEDRPTLQAELPFAEAGASDATDAGDATDAREPDETSRPASSVRQERRTAAKAAAASVVRKPRGTQSLQAILRDGTDSRKSPRPKRIATSRPTVSAAGAFAGGITSQATKAEVKPSTTETPHHASNTRSECSWENFVGGQCNELARTACKMAIESPGLASPLVLWGPPGSGKTHLLSAVAGKLRGLHRMRRVVYLSAEEFTNDFIKALNGNCLPAFRSRFRDADALLIDDIQFFVEKKATIRELHHTIEMLAEVGKPLVFAGTKSPNEINGLGGELSGRLASGLVCQVESLDTQTRTQLLARYAEERCLIPWPDATLQEIASVAGGDGRLLSGIVNLVALLQRMHGQMPSMDQIRQHGAHLLRSSGVPITLSAIERAVEKVFQLDSKSLQSGSQTKSITEPRMLAMYLAREMTSSAYSEIGGHFGGRSHSTAILANQRVRQWLDAGRSVGRGQAALSTDEAIRRIESMLKTG
ncbi:Chromosomal replication initiator protein DnaA [Stieleria magnilauensis]|uniref:Chromosomal replication initiator protein DnaA n=2 Tax=Stieleria magnilauensis TaxID=2527963 RepID=A0ABX5XLM3_9BACT|nr:Chromosomal replication initiator protein DnaA [Planctomycetes bacterium TBK1r]